MDKKEFTTGYLSDKDEQTYNENINKVYSEQGGWGNMLNNLVNDNKETDSKNIVFHITPEQASDLCEIFHLDVNTVKDHVICELLDGIIDGLYYRFLEDNKHGKV